MPRPNQPRPKIMLIDGFATNDLSELMQTVKSLGELYARSSCPAVLIITETRTVSADLGRMLRTSPACMQLSVNSIAPTFVKKVILDWLSRMSPKLRPSRERLDHWADSCHGDLHIALNTVYLHYLLCEKAGTVPNDAFEDLSCLSLFHSLGKILYKRKEMMSEDCPFETFWIHDRAVFVAFLQNNYISFLPDVLAVAAVAEDFSMVDSCSWHVKEHDWWADFTTIPDRRVCLIVNSQYGGLPGNGTRGFRSFHKPPIVERVAVSERMPAEEQSLLLQIAKRRHQSQVL